METRLFVGEKHQIKGDAITWIGIARWRNTLAFGTDSGTVIVTPDRSGGKRVVKDTIRDSLLSEPVNSAAFLNHYLCATSRNEIAILGRKTLRRAGDGPHTVLRNHHKLQFGGHNVISLHNENAFAVSVNMDGILEIWPDNEKVRFQLSGLNAPNTPALNVYKLAYVSRMMHGGDLVVAACRKQGIVGFTCKSNVTRRSIFHHFFGDADIIDVQAAGCGEPWPRAVVGLGADGTLFFLPDILGKQSPASIKPSQPLGEVYNLFVGQDSVFILTQNQLLCLPNVLRKWTRDRSSVVDKHGIECFSVEIEGHDILPMGKGAFSILANDVAYTFDVNKFIKSAREHHDVASGSRKSLMSQRSSSLALRRQVTEDSFEPFQNSWEMDEQEAANQDSEWSENLQLA